MPDAVGTFKGLTKALNAQPGQDVPIGYVRYPVVQSVSGNNYIVRFAGSTQDITARKIAGPTAAIAGDKVFAIQYGTGQSSEVVVIGKLA